MKLQHYICDYVNIMMKFQWCVYECVNLVLNFQLYEKEYANIQLVSYSMLINLYRKKQRDCMHPVDAGTC